MQKTLLFTTALALFMASPPSARAGDGEWATAGKVLTGLFAAKVIHDVVARPRVQRYSSGTVCTSQPGTVLIQQPSAVVYQQAPTVIYQQQPTVIYQQSAPVPVAQPQVVQQQPQVIQQQPQVVQQQQPQVIVQQPQPVYYQQPVIVQQPQVIYTTAPTCVTTTRIAPSHHGWYPSSRHHHHSPFGHGQRSRGSFFSFRF